MLRDHLVCGVGLLAEKELTYKKAQNAQGWTHYIAKVCKSLQSHTTVAFKTTWKRSQTTQTQMILHMVYSLYKVKLMT